MPLTDRTIKFATGRARPYYLLDGAGLYLRISPKATKTWYYRRQGARDQWKKLGRYPALTLLQARSKAAELTKHGLDCLTVREAWEAYLPHLRHEYDSHKQAERMFEVDVLPHLGNSNFHEVTRRDIAKILQLMVDRGAPVGANRTLTEVKHFFRYGVDKGWREDDPAAGITKRSVGGSEKPRERALSLPEIKSFIRILMRDDIKLRARLTLGLLLVVGQRPTEVIDFSLGEMLDRYWWQIPAARTKPRRAHKVYLPPVARLILRMAVDAGNPIHPFGPSHSELSNLVLAFKFTPPFTPHDLRRTMATRLADLGVMPHVTEKMLNHKMTGVMAVYNVGEYLPERRAAWRLWGRTLSKLWREVRREKTDTDTTAVRVREHSAGSGQLERQTA